MIAPATLLILSPILLRLLLSQKALNDTRTEGPSQGWQLLEDCLKEFQVQAAQHCAPSAQELLEQFLVSKNQEFALRLVALPEMLAEHDK